MGIMIMKLYEEFKLYETMWDDNNTSLIRPANATLDKEKRSK